MMLASINYNLAGVTYSTIKMDTRQTLTTSVFFKNIGYYIHVHVYINCYNYYLHNVLCSLVKL